MVGKTTAPFRCPCSDADAPRGVSFWVDLEGPGGWPSVLSGRCFRCGDQGVASRFHRPTESGTAELGFYAVRRRTSGLWRSNQVVDIVQSVRGLEDLTEEAICEHVQLTQEYNAQAH